MKLQGKALSSRVVNNDNFVNLIFFRFGLSHISEIPSAVERAHAAKTPYPDVQDDQRQRNSFSSVSSMGSASNYTIETDATIEDSNNGGHNKPWLVSPAFANELRKITEENPVPPQVLERPTPEDAESWIR